MALDNPSPYTAQILAELQTQNLVNYHTAVPDALFRSYLGSLSAVYSVAELTELTALDVQNLSLTDMSGIEYAASITSLKAQNNQLTDIGSVAALVNLTYLHLGGNQLTDIGSVATLVNLEYLYLYGNQLTDIGSVAALVNLLYLYLNDNQFSQSTIEAIIDDLWANRVALGANSCGIQLEDNPGSIDAATSRASEIADLIAAGCTVTI